MSEEQMTTEAAPVETTGAEATTEAPATGFIDNIPETYREKGYMQGVDSMDALLGKLDNAERLKGSKAYIPSDEADDTAKAEFKNMLQEKGYISAVPESYEFAEIEGVKVPEGINEKVGDIFKNNGISQEQANGIRGEWLQYEAKMQQDRIAAADKEFVSMAQSEWGENWAEATADVTMHLKENLPQEYKESLQNLPNSLLIPMIKAVSTAIGGKEQPDGAPGQSMAAHLDGDAVKAKFTELRKKAAQTGKPSDVKAFNDFQEHNRAAIAKTFGRG